MTDIDGSITRVFAAPRKLVFEVWTQAEHFMRWFAPDGADMPYCEMDARLGGSLRFAHRFEDGMPVHIKGTFREFVPDERLAFTARFVDEHGDPGPHPMFPDWPADAVIHSTVVFEDVADGTRVTVRQHIETSSPEAPVVIEHGRLAKEGWGQTLRRLGEYLEDVA